MVRPSFAAFAALLATARGEDNATPLVANGDFEDGLHGWDLHCALDRCAEATTAYVKAGDGTDARGTTTGMHAASLQVSADEWTGVALRQELHGAHVGPLLAEASIRASSPGSQAALELTLALSYEDAAGALVGSCSEERTSGS